MKQLLVILFFIILTGCDKDKCIKTKISVKDVKVDSSSTIIKKVDVPKNIGISDD